MECHRCRYREAIEAGKYSRTPFENTPCGKCELVENSEHTMEFDPERGDHRQLARQGAVETDPDVTVPISVLLEAVTALLEMPPEVRDAMCWRLSGMKYREIAVVQNVTEAAVEMMHRRALRRWPILQSLFARKIARHERRVQSGGGHERTA